MHSMLNIFDIYKMLCHGGLVRFSLSKGCIIRFCTGTGCINKVLVLQQNSLAAWMTTQSGIANWLWPGRPPNSYLEHITTAYICTALVVLLFTFTVVSALL